MNTRFSMDLHNKHYVDDLCRDADLAELAAVKGWSFEYTLGWYWMVKQ